MKPHVVWSRAKLAGDMLVGADGTAYLSQNGVRAVSVAGGDLWNAYAAEEFDTSVLLPGMIETADAFSGARVSRSPANGALLGSLAWPQWGARVAVDEDGASFVELIKLTAFGSAFAGIARVTAQGALQWIEKGDCESAAGDFPAPHDFVRRGDHLLLVCDTNDENVEVLEVDANDDEVSNGFVDGSLSGNVVAGNGDLAFFVTLAHASSSLVTFGHDGSAEVGGPTFEDASIAAVASDGTLVVSTNDGIAAISARTTRWQQTIARHLLFVDSDHEIVAATSGAIIALDLETGSKLWEVALPTNDDIVSLASAGPGKIYALSETALTLVSD